MHRWRGNPTTSSCPGHLADAFYRSTQRDSAMRWFQAWSDVAGPVAQELLYEMEGNTDGLRSMVDSWKQRYLTESQTEAVMIAAFNGRLREHDSTFAYLDQAAWNVAGGNALLYDSPFDSIRSDPRYRSLVDRIGVR